MLRLSYIDTLRGFASLMVVIFHGILFLDHTPNPNSIQYWLTNFFDLGKIGIVIFFAISGFVITWSLSNKSSLISFWKLRILRLYPAYWLSIISALVFGGGLLWSDIDYLTIIMNFTMIQEYLGFQNILGLYWTLSIEMAFYITISIIYLFNHYNDKMFRLMAISFLIFALLLATLRYVMSTKLPVALPLGLSIMFFSALLQRVVIEKDRIARRYIKQYLALFMVLMPIISLLAYNKDMGFNEVWYRYTISYFSAILIFISTIYWLKFSNKIGVFLGKISYSIYLFHPIVMFSFQSLFLSIYSIFGLFFTILLLIFLTIVTATITYHIIEKPFMILSKKITSV